MTEDELAALVDRMTLEEQVSLLSGADYWSLPAIPRLDIGKLVVTDGPNGARGGGSLFGGVTAACFPCGIALGSTWDPGLVEEVAGAIAEEVATKGAQVALAPTVNIQRTPLNGRNFECFSEDPDLAAAMAVAYVRGLQTRGVAATVKHFAGNESEISRTTVDTRADERTLREVYFRPFEDAARSAGAWGIMSAYNRLNGPYSAESRWLLTEVLRGEWGFDGIVMSDWFGSHSTGPTIEAGLDIEMPGPTRDRGDKLIAAVEAGEVPADRVRVAALNVLRLIDRTGAMDNHAPREERAEDSPAHRALIRRAGAAGAVLLQNEGLLPLDTPDSIAVIGPNAKVARIMGGGSAQLNPHHAVSPWEGLVACYGEDRLAYAPGCTNHRWEPLLQGPFTVAFHGTTDLTGPVLHREEIPESQAFWATPVAEGKVDPMHFSARITGRITPEVTGTHRFGMHVAGYARALIDGREVLSFGPDNWRKGRTFFEEGNDEVTVDLDLVAGQPVELVIEYRTKPHDNLEVAAVRCGMSAPLSEAAIEEAAQLAAGASVALVFAGRSGEWDTEGSDLTDMKLPGAQDALIAAVAAANPRTVVVLQTGGPVEMPWRDAVPAILQAWYPGQECGHAIADVLCGAAEPGGRLPQSFPARLGDSLASGAVPSVYPGEDGAVVYAEGVHIGYRHHERIGIAPLFPFGHGLGYTRFALEDLRVTPEDGGARVRVALRNTGDREGAGVVQVYVAPPDGSDRPARELKAFGKAVLAPGERRELEFSLSPRCFAWFDGGWRVDVGRYRIEAGFSAADLPLCAEVEMADARYSTDHDFQSAAE